MTDVEDFMDFIELNERVAVTANFAAGGDIGHACMPRVMTRASGGKVLFLELGLYHPTTRGAKMVHVFDMSDGASDYRLEFDAERMSWTLVLITEARDLPGNSGARNGQN
jgi:hypothetical protein